MIRRRVNLLHRCISAISSPLSNQINAFLIEGPKSLTKKQMWKIKPYFYTQQPKSQSRYTILEKAVGKFISFIKTYSEVTPCRFIVEKEE